MGVEIYVDAHFLFMGFWDNDRGCYEKDQGSLKKYQGCF